MSGAQISALVFGCGGVGALIAATVSNEWKVTSRASSVITATWVFQGLWMNCAGNALGSFHCRPHLTIFKVAGYIQACRGLMIAAVCLGFFGSIFALFGMKCTKVGGSEKSKAKIAGLAGIVFILSGLCSMTGCSLYANRITSEFFNPLNYEQKYELGAALFIGWAGASLCIIGGIIFCFSISEGNKSPRYGNRMGYAYNGATSVLSSRTKFHGGEGDFKTTSPPKQFDKNAYV
ncbi:claudin-10 isoform X1 [Ornithorhynchus anatinus]|uniref:claudin-10 isoform X1 n=1 Tax=Ornithorhynchus anatinus TaxID=9258 RepID=UPI0010A83593|nr:claudin-10 isoform X1 [Ornithorhynchus anatinus]